MMELDKRYNPAAVEGKWYRFWMEGKYFHAIPDPSNRKNNYSVVIPPPNVTGVLHMGHMLNNTIQDVLVRKARMEGKNTCWVPGTDHASIATEAKVVGMLREKGIKKSDLSREAFLKHAWEWKEKYGGIILEQLKKLGASCDWDRTRFTMEDELSEAVANVFIDLYDKGLIYRGLRMVNWDPAGKTALSDEEVIYKEEQSKLYFVKYNLEDKSDFVTIATTRPETILADTAICVNPNDERYQKFIGKRVLVPFVNRAVEIIADDYVAIDFGTGCLKVTPAHDKNDYELGLKYKLEVVDILTEDGFLNEKAQVERYIGKDRFVVRKMIAKDLEEAGFLAKVEEYPNQVGRSERTDAVIEPRLSLQWFVDMKKLMSRNPEVLNAVLDDTVAFYPTNLKNTYKHWIENIKDWCISRQLWWGQRIPAWYYGADEKEFVVAKSQDEALDKARKKSGNLALQMADIYQDEDVVDTWFSSWLWPISVFDPTVFENGGKPKEQWNDDLKSFYPTNDLVTAPEIMFFWVARMIMAGYEWTGEKPFENVYYTGIVRDKLRRKMSKSLGNSPDPLDLIATYGADGVRMGMLLCSPAGNDILFDESQVEQGRNFSNKLWNAFRLTQGWEIKPDSEFDSEIVKSNNIANEWFRLKFEAALVQLERDFDHFDLSQALMRLYKLTWDDLCSWYLEMVKPVFGEPLNESAYLQVKNNFSDILKLLHPFMPFITEELFHALHNGNPEKPLIVTAYPKSANKELKESNDSFTDLISEVRMIRNSKGLSPKVKVKVYVATENTNKYLPYAFIIEKLAGIDGLYLNEEAPDGAIAGLAGVDKLYVDLGITINKEEEKLKLEKELEYLQGFLKSVAAKLGNEKFVANAKPDLVEKERQKEADTLQKIEGIMQAMKRLEN